MSETMKSSIKILELAVERLENEANQGMKKLEKLGLPRNVIKMSDLLTDDDKGKTMLTVAQFNPAIILKSLALEQSFKLLILQQTNTTARGHHYSDLLLNFLKQ